MSHNGDNGNKVGGGNKSGGDGGNADAIRRLNLGHKPKQDSASSVSSLLTRASGSSHDGDRSNSATSGISSDILSAPGGAVSHWIPDVSVDGVRTPVSNNGRTLSEMGDGEIDTLFKTARAKIPPPAIAPVPIQDRLPRSCEELSEVVYVLQNNLHTEFSHIRDHSATRAVVEADTRLRVMRLEDKVKELQQSVSNIEKTTSQIPSIFDQLKVLVDRSEVPVVA